ncbi:MAG: DMT family transporter [Pseudomonadota bacterium]
MLEHRLFPVWLAFVAALAWGIWWMPVRWLEGAGLPGSWTAAAMLLGALPICVLFAWRAPIPINRRTVASGALIGGAMALYSAAITETTVVRAVLLFYLAPLWSLSIEVAVMGRRPDLRVAGAFVLAVLGVLTIFRFNLSFAAWSVGDTLALFSGISWSLGAALVFAGPRLPARGLALFGCMGGIVVATLCAFFLSASVPVGVAAPAVIPSLLIGTVYVMPVLVATLWSAARLGPTTLSFLLTGEILSGVFTAAYFLDEPFGTFEVAGAALIISAALVEVVSQKPTVTA